MRKEKIGWLGVLFGVLMLVAGWLIVTHAVQSGHDAPRAEYTGTPSCDGKQMSPGDRCIVTGSRAWQNRTFTYEEAIRNGRKDAKTDQWAGAEVLGGVGAVLVFLGVGTATSAARLSRGIRGVLVPLVASLPLTAVAIMLWPMYERTREASPVPVGNLGKYLHFPYPTVLALLVVLLGTLGTVAPAASESDVARDERRETERREAERARAGGPEAPTRQESRQQTSRGLTAEQREARERFDKGESDDPWESWRLRPLREPAAGQVTRQRIAAALGQVVVLLAVVLAVSSHPLRLELPTVVGGLAAVAGYALIAAPTVSRIDSAPSAWRWGLPALLSLAGAAVESTMSTTTWSGLLNLTLFLSCWGAFTWRFGAALPQPPVTGRVLFTALGLLSWLAAVRVVVVAAAPGSHGVAEIVAYVLAAVGVALGAGAFGTARGTEARNAVPRSLTVACHLTTAVALVAAACYAVLAGGTVIAWIMAGVCAVRAIVDVRRCVHRAEQPVAQSTGEEQPSADARPLP
ncbi:hypothetical protein GCM10023191_062180 [Actinoallomurus oryzae]|uniref:Uncharacterized protein n=1 Tax=Actinoallomurus oryzae TaxID=502180 RepID=A0ABP8QMH4_9ACTN